MSRRGPAVLDFDLNLAPIIDCFTVLITFMLASASFLSITLFDAGFTPSEALADPTPPPITIEVRVREKGSWQMILKGKENKTADFTSPEDVATALKEVRTRFTTVDSLTLTADDPVPYDSVVKTMEKIRPVVPAMVLGGF